MVASDRSFPRSRPILVVDDDPFVRGALGRTLKRMGHQVSTAGSAEEGLALLERTGAQVAFCDLRMPGMDGHAFMRAVSAKETPVAVVVMSGQGTPEDVLEVFKNGGVDFLAKPWRNSDLETAIARAFEVHDARAQKLAVGAPPPRPILFPSLVPLPPPELADDGAETEDLEARVDELADGVVAAPPVPDAVAAARAAVLADDPPALIAAVESDAALASRVLAVARSQAFAGTALPDLAAAVDHLGARALHGIVETIFLHGFGQAEGSGVKLLLVKQWRTGVARALAMRALVEGLGGRTTLSPEVAYQVGLLADVGASFMLWALDGTARLDVVRRRHTTFGAELVTRWGLPPEVARAIRSHHAGAPDAPASPYGLLLVVASDIAQELCEGVEVTLPDTRERVLRCASAAHLGPDVLARAAAQLRRDWVSVIKAITT